MHLCNIEAGRYFGCREGRQRRVAGHLLYLVPGLTGAITRLARQPADLRRHRYEHTGRLAGLVVERPQHAPEALSADYLRIAPEADISADMDMLPHYGAIITVPAICKLIHRQSYLNIAAVKIVFLATALIVVITLGTVFRSF